MGFNMEKISDHLVPPVMFSQYSLIALKVRNPYGI